MGELSTQPKRLNNNDEVARSAVIFLNLWFVIFLTVLNLQTFVRGHQVAYQLHPLKAKAMPNSITAI